MVQNILKTVVKLKIIKKERKNAVCTLKKMPYVVNTVRLLFVKKFRHFAGIYIISQGLIKKEHILFTYNNLSKNII